MESNRSLSHFKRPRLGPFAFLRILTKRQFWANPVYFIRQLVRIIEAEKELIRLARLRHSCQLLCSSKVISDSPVCHCQREFEHATKNLIYLKPTKNR